MKSTVSRGRGHEYAIEVASAQSIDWRRLEVSSFEGNPRSARQALGATDPDAPMRPIDQILALPQALLWLVGGVGPGFALLGQVGILVGLDFSRIPGADPRAEGELPVAFGLLTVTIMLLLLTVLDRMPATISQILYAMVLACCCPALALALTSDVVLSTEGAPLWLSPYPVVILLALAGWLRIRRRTARGWDAYPSEIRADMLAGIDVWLSRGWVSSVEAEKAREAPPGKLAAAMAPSPHQPA
ncbi:MAG: hypothetical protein KAG80_02760 [Nocardioides sp.]|nr:hypothetical protein [Nocardioides sp.]